MKPARKLSLRRETLAELTAEELRDVVGAQATVLRACETRVTVLVNGCPTNPQVCHYVTIDYC